jgi:hypothetical protein
MAWLSSVTADNTIVQSTKKFVERTIYIGSGSVYSRTNTIDVTHYVGLTKAAADSYVTAHVGDAGVEVMYVERENEADAYRVVAEVWTYGTWAEET